MEYGILNTLLTSSVGSLFQKPVILRLNSDNIPYEKNKQTLLQNSINSPVKLENTFSPGDSNQSQQKLPLRDPGSARRKALSNILLNAESSNLIRDSKKTSISELAKKVHHERQSTASNDILRSMLSPTLCIKADCEQTTASSSFASHSDTAMDNHDAKKSEEEMLEDWRKFDGPRILREALAKLKLDAGRVEEINLNNLSQTELSFEKKDVGVELKNYQAVFEKKFGRKPDNEEKEPMASLYKYYKKLDQQLKKNVNLENSLKEFLKSQNNKSPDLSPGLAKTMMKPNPSGVPSEMEKTIGKENVRPSLNYNKGSKSSPELKLFFNKTQNMDRHNMNLDNKSTLRPNVNLISKESKQEDLNHIKSKISISPKQEKLTTSKSGNIKISRSPNNNMRDMQSMSSGLRSYNEVQQKIALLKNFLKP